VEVYASHTRFIPRAIQPAVRDASRSFSAVVVTGPRRAGKTTWLRRLFPRSTYVLLGDPSISSSYLVIPSIRTFQIRPFRAKLAQGCVKRSLKSSKESSRKWARTASLLGPPLGFLLHGKDLRRLVAGVGREMRNPAEEVERDPLSPNPHDDALRFVIVGYELFLLFFDGNDNGYDLG
jgi:hypothetical protein